MLRIFFCLLLVFFTVSVFGQHEMYPKLARQLDSIYNVDQGDRQKSDSLQKKAGWQSEELPALWKTILYHDSLNMVAVKKIIDTHGWLGPHEVGDQGSQTIFLVIQHADSATQIDYLPVMRKAVAEKKARPQDLALLEDRVLIKQGKEQLYGSQLRVMGGKYEFFPIKDEAHVNERRASVGLPPLEEYAKYFGLEYKLPK